MNVRVRTLVASEYTLQVDPEFLNSVLDKDAEVIETLCEQLTDVDGVREVDYNVHFGSYIFINIDQKRDYSTTWHKIYKIIDDYIKE